MHRFDPIVGKTDDDTFIEHVDLIAGISGNKAVAEVGNSHFELVQVKLIIPEILGLSSASEERGGSVRRVRFGSS